MAYTADILGSLTGIAVVRPDVVLLAARHGLVRDRAGHRPAASCRAQALAQPWLRPAGAGASSAWPTGRETRRASQTEVTWSPYYQVRYKPRYQSIDVNNLGHQGMLPVELAGPAYMLPHLLNRDAGGKPFEDVLIIGAGSGNDVAAALRRGHGHVDAVEIDPVINELGPAAPSQPAVQRPAGRDPPRRRPQLRPQDRPRTTT